VMRIRSEVPRTRRKGFPLRVTRYRTTRASPASARDHTSRTLAPPPVTARPGGRDGGFKRAGQTSPHAVALPDSARLAAATAQSSSEDLIQGPILNRRAHAGNLTPEPGPK
jgi:hypothetical protein